MQYIRKITTSRYNIKQHGGDVSISGNLMINVDNKYVNFVDIMHLPKGHDGDVQFDYKNNIKGPIYEKLKHDECKIELNNNKIYLDCSLDACPDYLLLGKTMDFDLDGKKYKIE